MNDPQRYDMCYYEDSHASMEPEDDGDWVRWEDYNRPTVDLLHDWLNDDAIMLLTSFAEAIERDTSDMGFAFDHPASCKAMDKVAKAISEALKTIATTGGE